MWNDAILAPVRPGLNGAGRVRHGAERVAKFRISEHLPQQLNWLLFFTRYFLRRFLRERGFQVASALAYTTLLSLVPLLTVMFAFPGGMPFLRGVTHTMQDFLFSNFVPEFGDTVRQYVGTFSLKASQVTITGLVSLIVIALMLVSTIDGALNSIWKVRIQRTRVSRFLVYWAMITLGPILVGAGMLGTSYLLSIPAIEGVHSGLDLHKRLLSILPFLCTTGAFTLMYVLVPYCHVSRRHALAGALVAAVSFELAKYGFGVYVKTVPTEAIYGAIAVIPLFLIWIYASWVIILIGAHITYCLAEFRLEAELRGQGEAVWDFEHAYLLVSGLWHAQRHGRPLSLPDLRARAGGLPQNQVNDILESLNRARWVDKTRDGNWMLARDLDETSLYDLHRAIARPLPPARGTSFDDPALAALHGVLKKFELHLHDSLDVPLSTLMRRRREARPETKPDE